MLKVRQHHNGAEDGSSHVLKARGCPLHTKKRGGEIDGESLVLLGLVLPLLCLLFFHLLILWPLIL